MNAPTILVADDEAPQRKVLTGYFSKQGYRVLTAASGTEAIERIREGGLDLVLSDYRMPGATGLEVLRALKSELPHVPLILVTAYGSIDGAVEAMREGAFDYVTKPVKLDRLSDTVVRALGHGQSQRTTVAVGPGAAVSSLGDLSSRSASMQTALDVAARAARSDATVLVLGETGVGKEVVARAIHATSSRQEGPFVPVNCGALAEGVLESELFGHERGAFTGATGRREGRLEEANGGTLFLDELGDITPSVQMRLLRVLQDGEFQRLGSNDTLRTDARVIGATHRDLEALVREGAFREDLYYRLNVISVVIPPLRGRPEDIPVLAESFLERYAQRNGKQPVRFSPEAMRLLTAHSFPGNVRELENVVERAVVLVGGPQIEAADLPESLRRPVDRVDAVRSLPEQLERVERDAIVDAMAKAKGIQSHAADLLGINERNLRYKLQKYGLK